uniref:Uncharacterized protein n=1 Tax=Ciona savignyi TaxID=51511 RepID=H2ZIA4_CIOSA
MSTSSTPGSRTYRVLSIEPSHLQGELRNTPPNGSLRSNAVYISESYLAESNDVQSSEVFLPGPTRAYRGSSSSLSGGTFIFPTTHSRASSAAGISYISRSSSLSDVLTTLPLRQPSLADEAINAPRISRTSTRRSIGREWTRHHWDKVKDLEQESDRARRCSKLSSGFAPLMVFGGLVFVCIGVSAKTNTGKDRARLQQLSTTPLAMGVFMLALGVFLICSWFGCRRRARQLDQKVLHGSRRNSREHDNIIQTMLLKLQHHTGVGNLFPERPITPTLPGVTLDGLIAYKTPINKPSEQPVQPSVHRETSV